jgi:MFS family permease
LEWTLVSLVVCSQCLSSKGEDFYTPLAFRQAILTIKCSTYGLEDASKVTQANLSANIVSTLQAGCFFGALFASPIAEKWGRKKALLSAAVVAVLGIVMQCSASGHLEAMYIGRYEHPKTQPDTQLTKPD